MNVLSKSRKLIWNELGGRAALARIVYVIPDPVVDAMSNSSINNEDGGLLIKLIGSIWPLTCESKYIPVTLPKSKSVGSASSVTRYTVHGAWEPVVVTSDCHTVAALAGADAKNMTMHTAPKINFKVMSILISLFEKITRL